MYKAISKQLYLDDRQTQQLKLELENETWLFSSNVFKRSLAVGGHTIVFQFIFAVPMLYLLIISGLIGGMFS